MSELKVTLIGALLIAVGPVSLSLYTPALPELVAYFGTTEVLVQLSVTTYFLGFALAQLICGPLSDGLGRRPVIIGFMAVYISACVAILLSHSITLLLAARTLQGIGAAVGLAIARAIVRDVYSDARAFKIMNLMGVFIALAPAIAPTIGGLTLMAGPWQILFALMALMGVAVILVTVFSLRETVVRDVSRIRPKALLQSYRILLTAPYFMLASLVVACSLGSIYALATLLPFILMNQVGLSPVSFGMSQILQAGSFVLGAITVQNLLPRVNANALVPFGLMLLMGSSITLMSLLLKTAPTFLNVMLPIAVFSYGVAFILPSMLTNSLLPYPHRAGAASALTAFLQMAMGLCISGLASLFSNPTFGLALLFPTMATIATTCWLAWRRLPVPAS